MGKTFREMADAIERKYNDLWERADVEYERNGAISKATKDKLREAEIDMALLGI